MKPSNTMNRYLIKISGIALFAILVGCARTMTEGAEKLPRVKEKDLLLALDSINRVKPDFLYTKIDTRFSDKAQTVNFKTSLRERADSALHAMITYAGIPIVTAMVTRDSVKISNKRDKCFVLQDLEFFKTNFGIDFSFRNLEEVLLGLPLDYNPDDKYFQIHDPYNYIISSHRKRAIRRTERGRTDQRLDGRNDDEDESIIIKYFLTPDLKHLKRLEIESLEDSTSVTVDYRSYQEDKGFALPKVVNMDIHSPNNHVVIDMEYDKAEVNEPREMIIVIPESYEKCE